MQDNVADRKIVENGQGRSRESNADGVVSEQVW
jgi:hypothetical protein